MISKSDRPSIAYLAQMLPALSEAFVYEEMLGVEARGFRITPISVLVPARIGGTPGAITDRVAVLYAGSKVWLILTALAGLPLFGRRAITALRYLIGDVMECGLFSKSSLRLAFHFCAATRLARILTRERCRHLHVHFAHTPTQIAMYGSALSGVPFTFTAHANDIFERGLLLKRKAERATRVLTISRHNQQYLENLGIPHERLGLVRCASTFPVHVRSKRFDGRGTFRVGTLGRMVEKKGFDVLLRAVASLVNSGNSVELSIAGGGPLRAQLDGLARELGIAENVQFEGIVPHEQVKSWMQGLDAFVLACKQDVHGDMDGIPVVLMEAMSQSVPVVSTRISGIPELVIHERTGLLAAPGDAEDLARQIARLIQAKECVLGLTKRAREHLASEFGQATNVDRLLGYFALGTRSGIAQ